MMLINRKSQPTAEEVLAATAGVDNWKTWAGRVDGNDDGLPSWSDFFRGFPSVPPQEGTECPICYDVPKHQDEWHVVTTCGHACCKTCLSAYATSLVEDPAHLGPLQCPVCPCLLRTQDAIQALAHNPKALQLWDLRLRDQVLRRMSGYRPCPKCGSGNNGNDTNNDNDNGGDGSAKTTAPRTYTPLVGGGFATDKCLGVQGESDLNMMAATFLVLLVGMLLVFGLCNLFMYFWNPDLVHSWQRDFRSAVMASSIAVLFELVSGIPLFHVADLHHSIRGPVLDDASEKGHLEHFVGPDRMVVCPGCDGAFPLAPSSSEGGLASSDEWLKTHTRKCPNVNCAVPLTKTGGCKNMKCFSCGGHFCWNCMEQTSSVLPHACASY